MLDICIEYFILYVWKQKALCPKKIKTTKKKSIFFFLPFAAKWPGVNAASVPDDYLRGGEVYYLAWLGL